MRADNATKDRISKRAMRIACAITIAAVLGGCSAGSKNQGDSRDKQRIRVKADVGRGSVRPTPVSRKARRRTPTIGSSPAIHWRSTST